VDVPGGQDTQAGAQHGGQKGARAHTLW